MPRRWRKSDRKPKQREIARTAINPRIYDKSLQVRQSLTAPQAILGLGALSLTLKVKIITCIILSIVYQRLVKTNENFITNSAT